MAIELVDDLSTAPEPPPPPAPRGLGPLGWARWCWRQLTSMRTALLLLFLLALAAVPGSLFPQRGVDPAQVRDWARENPGLFPWLDRLSLFDVYASPWFSAVYLLLFVSLTGCVLPRSRAHWRAARARPPAAPRNLARLPVSRRVESTAPPAEVLAAARTALRRRRFRVDAAEETVAAEKGYLRETGNLVFHLALLLLLGAVALGHLYGYAANVVVAEGEGFANSPVRYDTFDAGPAFDTGALAPFSVTLDELDVRYEERGPQRGAPRDFEARVRWRGSPDEALASAAIRSNGPLVVGGSKVFLLGNGYAPRFTVRDGSGVVVLRGPVVLLPQEGDAGMTSTGALKLPDARPGGLGLQLTFLPSAVQTPFAGAVSVFPDALNPRVYVTGLFRGDVSKGGSVWRLDTSGLTPVTAAGKAFTGELGRGETLTLPDGLGSVTFDGVSRFANFQVAHDPGRVPALAAAVLAIGGLLASLFVRRRRVWVRATAGPGGVTVVEAGGLARTEHEGLVDEVDDLLAALPGRTPSEGHTT